ncbi:flavin reductase family protein [uncultured Erythrobacter sp.]|uniref:flavin reductase family protein n=1 Tax=uncultured Erythrobacter sp. TaxID=263913 RepID=UPI0026399B60|nr:flavin reductase family protein [uncultured Erythrobacter sp.]
MHNIQPAKSASTDEVQREFRRAMGLFTTGVCVISVPSGQQGVSAMTVNSFQSVSLDPMLVCWSIQNDASQFDLYNDCERFAVSILADDHAELARRYAARGDTLLRVDDFVQSDGGLPIIDGALCHFECRRWSEFVAGDHTIIFGEVTGMSASEANTPARAPLGFFNGTFCSIGS